MDAQTETSADSCLGILLGLLGVLIFSGTLPATRVAVAWFDPWFVTFARAALASAAAATCLAVMGRRFPKKHTFSLAFVGAALVFGFPGFMALAMQTVPSAHGGVVLGILPLATAIFATLWAGERPSPLFWMCGLLGAGIIVVFALRDGQLGFEIGDLWLLVAGLTAASGYVISGKLSHHMPGWEVICWALILTAPFSCLGTALLWQNGNWPPPENPSWALAYLAFGSMFLGFFAWNEGLRRGGIARVGQLQLLQTFFTLAIAALVLHETVTAETLLFAAAILIVVVLGQRARVATRNAG